MAVKELSKGIEARLVVTVGRDDRKDWDFLSSKKLKIRAVRDFGSVKKIQDHT